MEGFDYAWGFSSSLPAALKKAGASFVVRYVGTSSKCVTLSEVTALHSAGIAVGLVYEVGGTSFNGGRAAGQADGLAARTGAVKVGAPQGVTIYFAIDTDTANYALVNEYLAGAQEALGGQYEARIYAGFGPVQNAPGEGHWQTYAWSGGKVSDKAGLYQYLNGVTVGGASADHVRTLANGPVNRGGWLSYSTAPVVPAPVPPANPVTHPVAAARDSYAKHGNANAHAAEALKFEKGQNHNGAASWKNKCAGLVRTAYGISASAWGKTATNAAASWGRVARKDRHSWYNAPAGVPVYWTGGSSGAGHVAIADGLGNVWSNDFGPNGYVGDGKVRLVPIASIVKHDKALKYVGWGETYLGVRVYG